MRTQEEILARMEKVKDNDFFGFERSFYVNYLTFENAKPFLREGVTKEDWKPQPIDRDSILEEMKDYMSFAWEKANNFRGISAGRSMTHYSVWTWILNEHMADLDDYEYYGKDNLVKICEKYGWEYANLDDGVRLNEEPSYD